MMPISISWLKSLVLLALVGVGLLFQSFQSANGASSNTQNFTAADMSQLTNQYCLACHNDSLATAGLSLQGLDYADTTQHAETMEKMVKKLRAHMMPPSNMPRPPFETYEIMTNWLESELDRAWAAAPNPGRVTPLHRMNRYEYNNSVNDLLGLDVDVMDLLPGDPTADGSFDNIAESLPFSTAHMERYMSVARQLTRLATGLPANPSITTYEIPLYLNQDWRQNEDMPFGSRGGAAASHYFPASGEYQIKVQLQRNYQDYVKGLGWEQELEIRLDGHLLQRFSIGGDAPGTPAPLSFTGTGEPGSIDWETYILTEEAAGLEVRVPVTAGPHQVTASYVRQQVEREEIPQPVQGGRLNANSEVYLDYQKVHAIEIGGPYNTSIPGETIDSPSRRLIFSCTPRQQSEEAACATEILTRMGRQAYRRPLNSDDTDLLLNFFNRGREQGASFEAGIQFALEFMLSDPDFLIRSYDHPQQLAEGDVFGISDLELASRLSFFLWSSGPDDLLLALAEQNQLSNAAIYQQQVRRMLADDRGITTLVEDFAAQWLNLRRLDEVQINTVIFPEYDMSLIEGFEMETHLFVAQTLKTDASVLELLDANYSFLNERLARHYGVEGIYGSRFRKAEFPDKSQRGGLMGHGSLLAVTSYPGRTSPVLRGKWLLDNLLGTPPPPPPPNVPILPDASPGEIPTSIRERLARHRQDPVCSTCHTVIDPLGFALENFDVIGAWRDFDEIGNPVDPKGNYPGGVEFTGFADLRDWMTTRSEQFSHTLVEKLMTYALGRRVEYFDQPTIRDIVRKASNDDYSWSSLVMGIVNSPAFTSSGAALQTAQRRAESADPGQLANRAN
jgi:mono/diheme cytochrome c family protein